MTTKPKMSNWLAALAVVIGGGVQAQDFSIDWFGLAGGGGSSLGGDVQLSATIGQPAIGEISGGDFNIIAGFWSIVTVEETPGQPQLSVRLATGDRVIISWPGTATDRFILEHTSALDDPSNPWMPVDAVPDLNNGTKTVSLPLGPGNHFYRLHQPQ